MAGNSLSGKIQTVLGPIDPARLGVTLPHEHLSLSAESLYRPPASTDSQLPRLALTMANLGAIRQKPYSNRLNLTLEDEHQAVLEEVALFKKNGGASIVENSTIGLNRNVEFLRDVSRQTGVNILAGSGYYIDCAQTEAVRRTSEEAMTNMMMADILEGCDDTNVRCGHIGEIGCSWPLTAFERRDLRAAATTQAQLGCPLIIHPGRHVDSPAEIVRVIQEAGADVSKTVMSHLDRTLHDKTSILEFAALGTYCEYDLFGIELSYYQGNDDVDMPSDAQRIQRIKWLIDAGYEDNILIAQDVHTKHRLMKYGGHGYSHILLNVVPKMLHRGVPQSTIDKILVANPKRWLTFK